MLTTTGGDSLPFLVEIADVEALESTVRIFRALDYRCGGEPCRAALDAIGSWTSLLRKGTISTRARIRLSDALADLYNLLAWTEFDTGRPRRARRHFALAAGLAAESGNADLTSNICYRLGRLHLHHGDTAGALVQFGGGQIAARRAGSPRAQAILSANQAWAHAMRGEEAAALTDLGRAEEAFAAESGPAAPWAAFFDANDLTAMTGAIHVELARSAGPQYLVRAIPSLTKAAAGYGPEMARSLSLTQILLALAHALDRDFEGAHRVGAAALRTAGTVRSARTADRLRPLEAAIRAGSPGQAARDLLELIRIFRAEVIW